MTCGLIHLMKMQHFTGNRAYSFSAKLKFLGKGGMGEVWLVVLDEDGDADLCHPAPASRTMMCRRFNAGAE
jgi:hypothetical protein